MTQAIDDFFAGGVTAAKFEDGQFGTVIGGEIVADPRMQQQRDYESGEPISYPDGNPAMQMVAVVQAQKPSADDDGQRAFYIKGQLKQAVGEALRKVNEKTLRKGGSLWVKYVEDKPTTLRNGKRGNPQKIYVAKYDPPAQNAGRDYFADSAGNGPTGHPITQQAPPATAVRPAPAGVDPAAWAAMSREQQVGLMAALGGAPVATAPARSFTDEPPF